MADAGPPTHECKMSEDDRPDPAQMAVFRTMTPADRVRLAFRWREDAIRLRRACLRADHPGESDASIESRVREWCNGVRR